MKEELGLENIYKIIDNIIPGKIRKEYVVGDESLVFF